MFHVEQLNNNMFHAGYFPFFFGNVPRGTFFVSCKKLLTRVIKSDKIKSYSAECAERMN